MHLVVAWDVEALDQAIIAGSTDLRFARAASAGEYDGADDAEVPAETKAELEVSTFGLLRRGV